MYTHTHTSTHTHAHTHAHTRTHTHTHPHTASPPSVRRTSVLKATACTPWCLLWVERELYSRSTAPCSTSCWTPAAATLLQVLWISGYVHHARTHAHTHTHAHCLTCSHVPALARLLIAEQPVNCTSAWLGEDLRAVHTTSRAPSSYRVTRLESVHHHHGNSRGPVTFGTGCVSNTVLQRITVGMLNLW